MRAKLPRMQHNVVVSPVDRIGLKDNAAAPHETFSAPRSAMEVRDLSLSLAFFLRALPLLLLALCLQGAQRIDRIVNSATQAYGAGAVPAVRAWGDMLDTSVSLSEERKVRRVNGFFNQRIDFVDDQMLWGLADFWATPLDTLARGAGDCEDFAIAKYVSLRMLGLPDSKLRLIYVRAKLGGSQSSSSQAHMVLGYYPDPGGEPLVLDNLIEEVQPSSRRTDLSPIFSFNADGLWAGSAAKPAASATARLSRWRAALARMREQGFEFNN